MAESVGLELIPFQAGIYEFSGMGDKKHKFHISRRLIPQGIIYEADEKTGDGSPGFQTAIMDSLDCDQQLLFEKLKVKIKKILLKRYLKADTTYCGGGRVMLKNDEVVGRFEYNEDGDAPRLVIDGRAYTWEEFGSMLNAYEGFLFQLKIIDLADDIK
jgi:hypothetical protein